jgi:hypothetical protein
VLQAGKTMPAIVGPSANQMQEIEKKNAGQPCLRL